MKVGFFHCTLISAVFAIAGYFILANASLDASLPLSVAISLLLSGIITPWLASLFTSSNNTSAANSSLESATLYVGNLPYKANEDAVKDYFKTFTDVQSVRLMKDRRTGKRKGYGFVEILTNDIDDAIGKLNDSVFQERTLKVRPAKEKGEQ